MIKKLLVVVAVAALISFACFTVLAMMGGFPPKGFGNGPWGDGWQGWRGGRHRDPGPVVTRTLPYSGSTRLEISYPSDITVTQGDTPSFTITGPQNIIDNLQLNDGALENKYGPGYGYNYNWNRRYNSRLTITVVSPNTHEFHLAGAEKLTIRNFDQDSLILHIAGAGDVEAQGRTKRLEAHISGAGHLQMSDLTADDAELSISGAGDAELDARNSSEVSISGAGHVQFKCRPRDSHDHRSGFGSVDYGPSCSDTPAPAEPAKPETPAAPATPAPATPKTKV